MIWALRGGVVDEVLQWLFATDLVNIGLSSSAWKRQCLDKASQLNTDLVDAVIANDIPKMHEALQKGAHPSGWPRDHNNGSAFICVVGDIMDGGLSDPPQESFRIEERIATLELLIGYGACSFIGPPWMCHSMASMTGVALRNTSLDAPSERRRILDETLARFQTLLGVLVGHAVRRGGAFCSHVLNHCLDEEEFDEMMGHANLPNNAVNDVELQKFKDVITRARELLLKTRIHAWHSCAA